MGHRVYKLEEIELVGEEPTKKELIDLSLEDENNVLYKTVMINPALRSAYYDSASLNLLKKLFDKLYIYSDNQWEYLEEIFIYDLEERYESK